MQQGTVRWLLDIGDPLNDMNVACEVQTAELTDDPEDGAFILEIEAHEEGYLAAMLVPSGGSAAPDEAIAVICEELQDVGAFKDYPTTPKQHVEPATFAWQAYLKSGQDVKSCSNS